MAESTGMRGKRLFYGWVVVLGCLAVTLANGGLFFTFGVLFKPLAVDFEWGRGQVSSASTAFMLGYAPGAILWGRLADRYGSRLALFLAALFVGVGFSFASQVQGLAQLILCYLVAGAGTGATLALPAAVIQRWFIKRRGLLLGVVSAGPGVGALIFAPVANLIVTHYDWRMAYLSLGIVFGVLVVLGAYLMGESPEKKGIKAYGWESLSQTEMAQSVVWGHHSLSAAQAFRTRTFWVLIVLYSLTLAPTLLFGVHFVPYATDKGFSPSAAATMFGFIGATSVVGRLIMGGAADRIGWMKGIALSNLFMALSVLLLVFVNREWILYLFVPVYGFFYGGVLPLLMGAVGFLFGTTALAGLIGLSFGLSTPLGATSPLLAGLVFDWTDSYTIALVLSIISFMGGALCSLVLKPPAQEGE